MYSYITLLGACAQHPEQAVGPGARGAAGRCAAFPPGQALGLSCRTASGSRGSSAVKVGVPGAAVSGWILHALNVTGVLRAFTT